ncbi:MAG TPA: hypothetical protein VFN94_05485 [Nitrospiria bacterium]|nr:hypothetical protein [Nitrospiria bacterium]
MRPIAEQQPLVEVLSASIGHPGVLCHSAYCSIGLWRIAERPGGDVPVVLGSAGNPSGHRVHFFAKSYAATLIDPSRQASVAAEFGIERFAKAYGLEPLGTGIGLGMVTRYDAYLCVYEADSLSQIGLTEQTTSDPEAADVDEALDVLAGSDGARVCLMIPYGYVLGVLRFDPARRRVVITDGDIDSPSYTVIRSGLTIKSTTSRVIPKAIERELGTAPSHVYEIHRHCGWKERIEYVGRIHVCA